MIGSATTSHPRFGGDFFAMTSGRTTDLERIPLAWNHPLSFRGARVRREPGIHNHRR